MNVLEMEDMIEENKEIVHFFEQLNINDVQKLRIDPRSNEFVYYTFFHFETKKGEEFVFLYEKNKKVADIFVKIENDYIYILSRISNQNWMQYIWEQLVTHFNLHAQLMFINKNMPWRWNLIKTK
jgi:hypothetical protein